ncbi:MAG TPA: alpha/beta hydrolase [Roseiflexaceae bacterium]|nr:alpha/beta hydrolase [Roseiflexaceae bacterium]HMP41928.1 alpha/beta hydrolase [Roseiflexaceae bacterium]
MSIIVIDQQVVHYEIIGRGRPVLFLHGWLGSWRYWFPTMSVIGRQFRTYSFDFWGFGDSRRTTTDETIQNYSDQVIRFLDELGIDKVPLVGHSMGGMVALKTAIDHPDRISSVAAVGAPIVGSSLSPLLKLTRQPQVAYAFARLPWLRRFMFRHFLGATRDPAVHEVLDDSVKASSTTLNRAVVSMGNTDLRPELAQLCVPTLIVHGSRDEIVNPDQVRLFTNHPLAQVELIRNSRHFPFLDEPDLFHDLLLRFLNQTPPLRGVPFTLRESSPVGDSAIL